MAKVIHWSNMNCCNKQVIKINPNKKYVLILGVESDSKEEMLLTLDTIETMIKGEI